MHQPGIYAIQHRESGRMYIGSSQNITQRWCMHRSQLRKEKHHSTYLQRVWSKYGEDAFDFIVLEQVEDHQKLIEREQYYLDTLKPIFNGRHIADRQTGIVCSAERKAKISKALLGRKVAPEVVEKIRRAWLEAYQNDPSIRQRMSKASKARWKDPEYRAKMARRPNTMTPAIRAKAHAAVLGSKQSPEHVEKLRQTRIGRKRSQETIEKHRAKVTGQKRNEESLARMRTAAAKKWANPETREKARQAALKRWQTKPRGPTLDETRRKMSEARIGKKRAPFSEQARENMRQAAQNRAPRAPISDEARQKMRQAALRRHAARREALS